MLARRKLLDAAAQAGLDGVGLIEVLRPQQQALALQCTGQVLLGEGRALVGKPGLVADQRELAREALATQRINGLDGAWPPPTMAIRSYIDR